MQTNVQIDSKNIRNTDDNFRSRSHHITIEVSVSLSFNYRISLSRFNWVALTATCGNWLTATARSADNYSNDKN